MFLACVLIYRASRKHDWSDPTNQFAPFTWQIEGMSKPGKALSNIPTALLSEGQDPMGQPIKKHYDKDEMMKDLPTGKDPKQGEVAAQLLAKKGITEPPEPAKVALVGDPTVGVKILAYEPEPVHTAQSGDALPTPSSADVAAAPVPMTAQAALADAQAAESDSDDLHAEAQALRQQAADDRRLAQDIHDVQVDEAEIKESASATKPAEPKPNASGTSNATANGTPSAK